MSRCNACALAIGLPGGGEDEITVVDAGPSRRPVGHDLHDAQTESLARPLRQTGRERRRGAGDAEVGAAHAAFGEQRRDDAPGGVVDRDGEAEPDAGDRGVDADDFAGRVGERAAGVAGVERGVGLDDVVDDAQGPGRSRSGSERPSALTTPAVTLPASPSGLPTATTSWPTRRSDASPSLAGGGVGPSRADDREIRQRVGADDAERCRRPVGERRRCRSCGRRRRGRWSAENRRR